MRRHLLVLVIAGVCAGQEPPAAPEAPPVRQKSRFDPPATLGHLETTTPEQRKQIDDLIVVMFDLQRGRESLDAKSKLVSIGKPAFLPILGRMASIRDTIGNDDSEQERLVESSLKLADECLRGMDGYLDAHDKAPIRPGAERKYIEYILRIHYRRWLDGMGSPPLKDRNAMPGAFDPEHLETTPADLRAEIDRLIGLMLDPEAGRASLDAKAKLVSIGKPAFLPVLGAMARLRDTITDTDSMEERMVESSLMLADECLRGMDGYLDAHDKAPIRPGAERKYIEYVLRVHHRRWLDGMGKKPLKDLETMPGPFDPTKAAPEEEKERDAAPAGGR